MDDRQRIAAAQAFRNAVAAATSQSEFARRTGLKQQNISNLLRRGDLLPAEYVLAAEREFGISKHTLRPDIYPVHDQALASIGRPPVNDTATYRTNAAPVRSNDAPAFDQERGA